MLDIPAVSMENVLIPVYRRRLIRRVSSICVPISARELYVAAAINECEFLRPRASATSSFIESRELSLRSKTTRRARSLTPLIDLGAG